VPVISVNGPKRTFKPGPRHVRFYPKADIRGPPSRRLLLTQSRPSYGSQRAAPRPPASLAVRGERRHQDFQICDCRTLKLLDVPNDKDKSERRKSNPDRRCETFAQLHRKLHQEIGILIGAMCIASGKRSTSTSSLSRRSGLRPRRYRSCPYANWMHQRILQEDAAALSVAPAKSEQLRGQQAGDHF
jgi:hypothetical protein